MANYFINPLFINILIVFFWQCKFASGLDKCVTKDPCLCTFNEFSKIDLSSVINPSQPLSDERKGITYYFSGCHEGIYNYTEVINGTSKITKSIPYSLLVINAEKNITTSYLSKHISYEPTSEHPNQYSIVYRNGTNVTASIRLICDTFDMNIFTILDTTTNALALASPHVCVQTQHPGLSTGSVLLILFFFCFGTYLFGGMIMLYFMRGARGIEIIPNIDFWKSLPGLVKDGVIFILSGCRPTFVSTAESYDRI